MIRTENISFSYGKKTILDSVNMQINEGDIVSLLGPNGAGKSTLIKILLGLLNPDTGDVYLESVNIKSYKEKELARKVAYVPQSSYLPFSYSVLDIVIMGRISYKSIFSKYSKKDKKIAENCLERLGILTLKDKMYNELSGGQQQLVLISRALAQEAKVFIMDEPVSGLDYGNQMRLLESIKHLADQGYTFLKSTHYPDHAFLVSNKAVLMKEGKILTMGSPDETITKENINILYGIDVSIEMTFHGSNMCIPKFIKDE